MPINPLDAAITAVSPTPAQELDNTIQANQTDVTAVSKDVQAEVAANSIQPEIPVYNLDGEYQTTTKVNDGDGLIKGQRAAYGKDKNLYALDTYETDHGDFANTPSMKRKLARQRLALSIASGLDDITNEDVYRQGELAKTRAQEFFRKEDGTYAINIDESSTYDSVLKAHGDSRKLGQQYTNEKGEDFLTHMNTPATNASFNSGYNALGKGEFLAGSQETIATKQVSDFDAQHTTIGRLKNAKLYVEDAAQNLSIKVGDLLADGVASLTTFPAQQSDITADDTTMFKKIKGIEVTAGNTAKLELERQYRAEEITRVTDAAIAGFTEGDIPPAAELSESQLDAREARLAERTEELTLEGLSSEELEFRTGGGVGSRKGYERIGEGAAATTREFSIPTADDRFSTLTRQSKVRGAVNEGISAVTRVAEAVRFPTGLVKKGVELATTGKAELSDRPKTPIDYAGATSPIKTRNTILNDKASVGVEESLSEAKNLYAKEDYVGAAKALYSGVEDRVLDHPEASFLTALAAGPDIALLVTAPFLGVMVSTHDTYNNGREEFYDANKRHPKGEEAALLLATSTAKALIDKGGAGYIAGKNGAKLTKAMGDLLNKRIGATGGFAATLAAASFIEGGEEAITNVLEQYGVGQDVSKINKGEVYKTFVEGFASGAPLKAVMDSTTIPTKLRNDVIAASKLALKGTGKVFKGAGKVAGTVFEYKPDAGTTELNKSVDQGGASMTGVTVEEFVEPKFTMVEGDAMPDFVEEANTETPSITAGPQDLRALIGKNKQSAPVAEPGVETEAPGVTPKEDIVVEDTAEEIAQQAEMHQKAKTHLELVQGAFSQVEQGGLVTEQQVLDAEQVALMADDAYANFVNSRAKEDLTPEQVEDFEARAQVNGRFRAKAVAARAALTELPSLEITDVDAVGTILSRGSEAVADIDLDPLENDLAALVQRLSQYNRDKRTGTDTSRKNSKEVDAELYGTGTNASGKGGLGLYMARLGGAVSSGKPANAMKAIHNIVRLHGLQKAKHAAISKGWKEFQAKGHDGSPIIVNYGKGGKFKIEDKRTEGFLANVQKSIDVLQESAEVAGELATAKFAPTEYKRNLTERKKAAAVQSSADHLASSAKPASTTSTNEPTTTTNTPSVDGAANKPSEAGAVEIANDTRPSDPISISTDLLGKVTLARKSKATNKYVKLIGTGLDQLVKATNTDLDAGDVEPTAAPIKAKIAELVARLPEEFSELVTTYTGAAQAATGASAVMAVANLLNGIEAAINPVSAAPTTVSNVDSGTGASDASSVDSSAVSNSPDVDTSATTDKQSTLEKQETPLFMFNPAAIAKAQAAATETIANLTNPVLKAILMHSRKVRQFASKETSGVKADSVSSRLLRPLWRMIEARQSSDMIAGIIGRSVDLFNDLRAMSSDRFNSGERAALRSIEQFAIEFRAAITAVVPPVLKKGGGLEPVNDNEEQTMVFRELANRSPVFQLLDESGQLSDHVKDAIAIASLEWIQANGKSSQYQSKDDAYQFFGLDKDSGALDAKALVAMRDVGMHAATVAMAIGKATLRNLNIKQANDPTLDGNWETRMAQSIGDLAIVSLVEMKTSHADTGSQENRGYLEKNTYSVADLRRIAFASDIVELSDDTEGDTDPEKTLVTFVRMPTMLNELGKPRMDAVTKRYVLGDSLIELFDLIATPGFRSAMKAIIGTHRSEGGTTAVPKKAPAFHTGTTTRLTPSHKKYVEAVNAQTMRTNPQWDLMLSYADNPNEWLRMHGWVEPIIDDEGVATFPEMHKADEISALGRNLGLEREYAAMQIHMAEWAESTAEVREAIVKTEERLITDAAAGASAKALGKIHKAKWALEAELQAYENGDIHIEHHVISTSRVNDKGMLSPQRSKMHRNALTYVDHVEMVYIDNPAHTFAVVAGLAEPMGLGVINPTSSVAEFVAEYIGTKGSGASDPVIAAAVEAIILQTGGSTLTKGQQADISDAVLKLKEGPHSLSALMVVAGWTTAARGDGVFESHGYTEVDGTTNGVIASMRQLVGGYSATGTDADSVAKTQRIRDLFNAGGQIFTDQDYVEGTDYLLENPDAYQNVGALSAAVMYPVVLEVRDLTVAELRTNSIEAEIDYASAKRDKVSPAALAAAKEYMENARLRYGMKVFSKTIPDFTMVAGKVNDKIRKMMKAVVMPGGYQAGDKALHSSLFNAWLSTQYGKMAEGDFEAINDTLDKLNLPPVTEGTKRDEFEPAVFLRLKDIYAKSAGAAITSAYRTSMGDFNYNAKTINAAFGVMGIIVASITKKRIAAAEAKKGLGVALTKAEVKAIRLQLHKEGVFVGFKQFGATGYEDSMSIVKQESKIVSADRGGYVVTPFAQGAVSTNNRSYSPQGEVTTVRGVRTSAVTSRIKEDVPSADVGVSGMITAIIGIDAITQALSMVGGLGSQGNMFDAKITSMLNAAKEASHTNATWDRVHREWSIWDAVGVQMFSLIRNHPEEITAELSTFFQEASTNRSGKKRGNPFAPTTAPDSQGNQRNFKGIHDFVKYFEFASREGKAQSATVSNLINRVAQYLIPEGYADVGPAQSENKGSDIEQVDTGSFDAALRTKATPEVVTDLFYGFVNQPDGIKDSAEHTAHLTKVMDTHIIPLVTASAGYTVSADAEPGIAGGAIDAEGNVFIRTSDTAIRLFSTDMSGAEVLTHEFMHGVWEAGLKNNAKAVARLLELQQIAIADPDFTPESLTDANSSDRVGAEARGKARYDYITSNIHEFAVFGSTNAGVMAGLAKVDTQAKTKGRVASMIDGITDIFESILAMITGKVIGRTGTELNVASELDGLLNSFNTTVQVHLANRVASSINNKYVTKGRGFLAEKVAAPLMTWGRAAAYKSSATEMLASGKRPTAKEVLTVLAKSPVRVFDTGFQRATKELVTLTTDYRQDFFSRMAREALGASDSITRAYHVMLGRINEHVDSASLVKSREVKRTIESAMTRDLSPQEEKLLADTLLRGDMGALGLEGENLALIIGDSEATAAAVLQISKAIAPVHRDFIMEQAANLGSVMINGETLIENGMNNAFNIVSGVGTVQGVSNMEYEGMVDQLKTLFAIQNLTGAERTQLSALIREQPHGIRTILGVDAVNREVTLRDIYHGDKSRVIAGEVIGKSNNKHTTQLFNRAQHAQHLAAGFTMVRGINKQVGLYTKPGAPTMAYQKGIFSMGNTMVEGTAVSIRDRVGNEGLQPIVSGGQIVSYRQVMNRRTREVDAGMSIGAAESLGNHAGRNLRMHRGTSFNNKIVHMAHADYQANEGLSTTKADGLLVSGFIRIHVNSPIPQVAEFARMMPKEMRDEVKEIWGQGGMYLRQNHLDLMVGYRKLSLVDAVNQGLGFPGDPETNAAVAAQFKLAENLWQSAISEVKRRTVLFTPAVIIANGISNFAVSMLFGMNPVDIIRDQREGLRGIKAYTKLQSDLAAVTIQIELGNDLEANGLLKGNIQEAMESSGVHNMVQSGMFQSIVEDIDVSAGATSPLANAVTQALPNRVGEYLNNAYTNAPNSVKKGLGIVMLSPNTEFGADIQAATAFSDFMARYALMKDLMRKGMAEADAMAEVMDVFVDYAPNTSQKMQYINDSGLYMYTKFLMRIQRVIMRAMRRNPEGMIAMEAAQQLMGDASEVTDASLLLGFSFAGGRTQTPDEVVEMLTQLPLPHLLTGIKDLVL